MAKKRIRDLNTTNTKVLATDRLPMDKPGLTEAEYRTGQNLFDGVLDPTNSTNVTNFGTMLTKIDYGTRYAMAISSSTPGTNVKFLTIGEVNVGTPFMGFIGKVFNIKFKIKVLTDVASTWCLREYNAIFIQETDGTLLFSPLVLNPTLGGLPAVNGQTLLRMLDMSENDPITNVSVYASNTMPNGVSYDLLDSDRYGIYIKVTYAHPFGANVTSMSIVAEVF